MWFSVTKFFLLDAISVGTRQFSVWVTSTDLTIIVREFLEAALRVILIRTIWAVLVTVAVRVLHDAVSRDTLEHSWWAESHIVLGLSIEISLKLVKIGTGQ